jgi:hypothetical protein
MDLLKAQGKEPDGADAAKVAKYGKEQEDISKEASGLERESAEHIQRHEKLASAVTLFQIGIAVSAIAVLTKRRLFWFVGLVFGCGGLAFLIVAYR